jgi:hypothetical protein
MKEDSYRSAPPTRCASCGVTFDRDDAFLSSQGPVCAACHKRDAQTIRERDRGRASSTDALMNGVFALGAAAMIAVVAFVTPDGMVPARVFGICGLSVVALVVCALRSWRLGAGSQRAVIGRILVVVGVIAGAISAIEIVDRFGN